MNSIGKGFSSTVYRGTNQNTSKKYLIIEQQVAIKVINMAGIKDKASKQMLDNQIQALTNLKHPNIMKLHQVIWERGQCFIITQLCDGGDLQNQLKKRGCWNQSQATKILNNIISGFVQMAQKKFVHRDMKLANVLLNKGVAKIADFGFARKLVSDQFKDKVNVGSPLYMSPQSLKYNVYSIKNDIWSIGIIAYQMLTGTTPWNCRTQQQLIDKMTRIPVTFRDSFKISNKMKDFIKKCLEVSQSKRMSLSGLKQWISSCNKQNPQKPQKPKINIQNQIKTTKVLQQKNLNEIIKNSKQIKNQQYKNVKNQRNKSLNRIKIPKQQKVLQDLSNQIINQNNNIIYKEILIFRLFFKTVQKLKKNPELIVNKNLCNILGNQTIRRVTFLKKLICSQDIASNQHFKLKQVQDYLNSIINPKIKKYKTVVNEYFLKYTSQIKMQILQGRLTPSQTILQFLKSTSDELIQQQKILIFWLMSLINITPNKFSKSQLQNIIDAKTQIDFQKIKNKIQGIRV